MKSKIPEERYRNSRKSFWQALIMTIFVFIVGIFLGITYEGNNLNKMNDYYIQSEIFLLDTIGLSKITDTELNNSMKCNILIDANIEFADRIYAEARSLERYEDAGKLTDSLNALHKKYDLLRVILWINTLNVPNECKTNTSTIVYLYERNTEDLTKKATNNVWSKILYELKQEKGSEIILIPIATDSNLTSLGVLTSKFNITEKPVLIINNKQIVTKIQSEEEIKQYLNNYNISS